MDTLQATYRDDDTDEDSPPLPPPITAAATLANAVVVPDMKPELPEQNRVIDIKQHLEAAASEDVSPEEISSYGIETPGDADQIDKHGTLNSGDLPPEIGTDEVGEGGEVEEEEEEEEPPQKKQKTLPDLPKRETPDSKITEMPPPADAVPPPPRSGKPPTAKSGKKSKKKDVWTTTTRKGKKKTKHASNSSHSSKNPTYGHPLAEDRMLISPVPRFPDKIDDSPDSRICLSKVHKAEKVELSDDRMTASSTKGYRMVRATRGVVEGAWYFEIKVVRLGETGHTRLGWSTDKGDLQAPVGYDGNSFGYRDIDGSKVHKALRYKYGGEGYKEGDVIGFYINLPDGGAYAPNPRCLVWHKGQRYVSAPDAKEEPPKLFRMKRSSCIVLRPVCFLMALVLMVLSLSGLLIPLWIIRVTKIENEVKVTAKKTNQELISGIRKTATLFSPINASAINLVRVLTSSLEEHDFQFSEIESKVASTLFQALSTVPYLSQISYIGLDGLFFAYYTQENQIYAMYSNSTFSDAKNYSWYIQSVNRDSGKLYGEAIKSPPFDVVNSTYFQEASSNKNGYASVGTSWGDTQNILLLSTVSIYGKGVVSLGYPMQSLIDFLINEIRFYDGSFYLASKRDGSVLAQGIPNTRMILAGDRVAFQLLSDDDYGVSEVGNLTCQSNDDSTSRNYVVSFSGKEYVINCSPLDIAGLPLVYALAMPHEGLSSLVHKNIKLAFVMLMLMIGVVVITILTFVYLIVEAARREMHLCGALISQMEATQQSERKSMNKSLAFASASHDIRASLAGINGLIEICRNEVSKCDPLRSEIPANLLQMESCTRDLLGILNSILDTSKIEAGKMQLDEEEFDLEKLMEDVVDLYHPVGTKKGVDVILDQFDGSVTKFSRVRGDRGKLKQILSNLLSNAVKFTSNGHVVVRVWAKKPSLESGIISSNRSNSMSCLLCLFKIQRAYSESEATQRETNNRTEFVFEVNDTGKGIPKEKQKSVFENYVQVKETALGQEGTGLGLGIVQSLVRLMGGEIGIVDKEAGERGTCFRFNAFFETDSNSSPSADIESIGHDSFRHSGTSLRTHSPKNDGSQVLLLIDSPERSTLLQDFMHRIGIKVHVVKQYEQLSLSLKRIKRKLNLSNYSSSGKSTTSSARSKKEFPLSALEGTDDVLPNPRPGFSGIVLIVIDTSVGPFREISRAVAEFRRDLSENCCSRVVWLDSLQGLDEDNLPPLDLVISKPFHGSRLYRTIGLLPEFGGLPPPRRGEASHSVENVRRGNDVASSDGGASKSSVKGSKCEIEEVGGANSKKKPLMERKILVADDDPIGRKIATFVGVQLGASIFPCENGEEAWKLVCKSLDEGKHVGASKSSLPFDCILMDCEMPMMNGVEATTRIRKAEETYGVRIPIIALTAHKKGQEIDNMIQAGVDGYLTKPLNKDVFLKTISEIICNV